MKLAISGKMCSGKSTLKEFLKDKIDIICDTGNIGNPQVIEELSFGKPIKEMYNKFFPYNKNKDRDAYQSIGDAFRGIDNDVFTNYLVDKCSDDKIIIVDDLRFKNEYNILKKNGFICIRIIVDEDKQRSRFYNLYPEEDYEMTRTHKSEVDLDFETNFDYIVNQIKLNNLNDKIFIYDYLNDEQVVALYLNCLAVVVPTYVGRSSLPLLESFYFKKTIFYSKDILDPALEKFVNAFDLKNPHDLAHKISEFLDLRSSTAQEKIIKAYDYYSKFLNFKTRNEHVIAVLNDFKYLRKRWKN